MFFLNEIQAGWQADSFLLTGMIISGLLIGKIVSWVSVN